MKSPLFKAFALCIVSASSLHADQADLVKTCQNFKKAFLEACQIIPEEKYTSEMRFLKDNFSTGGSVIFYGVIGKAIDDIVALFSNENDTQIQELINDLKNFKAQIDSDFMYDLNTCTVVKKEITRAGTTRIVRIPYNEKRCYKIAHNLDKQEKI